MKRFQPAVAILRIAGVSAAFAVSASLVEAADRSFPETVTNAFETVVIDAKVAAEKATAAAKKALASEPGKSKSAKKSKPDADAKSKSAAKADAAAVDKKSDGRKSAAKSDAGKEPAAKTDPKAQGNDAAKAADSMQPGSKDAPATKAADKNDKDTKPAEPAKPAIAAEWPAVDVELARARCTQLLKGVDAVTIPEAPFRKGDCGTLAPVRLISIGKNPEVSLSPPPVVTCDMVVALTKWVKQDVQPLARRHLGAEVIRMESMSDYSCRMAYGRVGNKLSEHGKANALDIRGFTTRKGEQAVVLTDWGQTKRDVEKQIAAAKAAAAKAEAVKVAAEKADAERARNAALTATKVQKASAEKSTPETVGALPRKTLAEGLPNDRGDLAIPAFVPQKDGFGMAPTHLGGPKESAAGKGERTADDARRKPDKKSASKKDKEAPETVAALPPEGADQPAAAPAPKTPASRFLHEAHAAACRIFGTTLGPEANEAHRNHFHVDMAERKVRKICD
jgi:hypothetical protein